MGPMSGRELLLGEANKKKKRTGEIILIAIILHGAKKKKKGNKKRVNPDITFFVFSPFAGVGACVRAWAQFYLV